MSGFQGKPWSDNPNAPKIPPFLYHAEKTYFAGTLIGAILYGTCKLSLPHLPAGPCSLCLFDHFILGTLIVLFFQCMAGLVNPARRGAGEGIRWGLVSYTAAMFSFVTVYIAMSLDIQSLAFVDNREFPYNPPLSGPLGYRNSIYSRVLGIIPNLMFLLNYLLADGLLVSSLFGAAPLVQRSHAGFSSSSFVAT